MPPGRTLARGFELVPDTDVEEEPEGMGATEAEAKVDEDEDKTGCDGAVDDEAGTLGGWGTGMLRSIGGLRLPDATTVDGGNNTAGFIDELEPAALTMADTDGEDTSEGKTDSC